MTRTSRPALLSPPPVRPPLQDRSREVWQRILDAGVELLAQTGVAKFNVAGVCQRAGVAMTAVYARVDSRDDLLHAVYDHGAALVSSTESRLAAEAVQIGAQSAVDVIIRVFTAHGGFIRAVALGALDDDYIAVRGQENVTRARSAFVAMAVGADADAAARTRARTLFTATFSTLTFEATFGPQLVHGPAEHETETELRSMAAALFPPNGPR